MMQELIDKLHNEHCSLAILHEGNIKTYEGHGIRRLYDIAQREPELLLGAKLAAKAVGMSAAKVMVDGGVVEVWAEYLSHQAWQLLESGGVTVHYEKLKDHDAFLKVWERLNELREND